MALWVIRILFLLMCTVAGYAISQVRPEFVGGTYSGAIGMVIGFGFGWLMIAMDEMLKGLKRNGILEFYVEAVVATSNVASNRLARTSLSECPSAGTDAISGKAVFQYLKLLK